LILKRAAWKTSGVQILLPFACPGAEITFRRRIKIVDQEYLPWVLVHRHLNIFIHTWTSRRKEFE